MSWLQLSERVDRTVTYLELVVGFSLSFGIGFSLLLEGEPGRYFCISAASAGMQAVRMCLY